MPALLKRIGIVPDDTEFNRRAKAYAQGATRLANGRIQNAKARKLKK